MKRLKNKVALLLCSALTMQITHGTIVVTGGTGTTAGQTSNQIITNRAMHKPSGTLVYTTTGNNSNNAIFDISRPSTTDTTVTASGIAADTTLRNSYIPHLAIVSDPTTPGNASLIKIAVTRQAVTAATRPTAVYLITPTAGTAVVKTPLDAEAVPAATANIVGLAGGNAGTVSCVFACVKKNGTTGTNFGMSTTGDGVAVLSVNNTTLAMTQVNSKAYALDVNSTGSLSVGNAGAQATTSLAVTGVLSMAYDEDSQRLYVGMKDIAADNATSKKANAGAYSIGIFSVSSTDGTLTQLSPCGGNNVITPLVGGGKYIIGQRGAGKALSAQNIRVMTTSTGPSAADRFKYLIVNGGNGTSSTTNNQVWAIPLVVGNATATKNGTFAAVTTGNFINPASAAGDLYLTSSAAAKVGNGPLPIPNSQAIADMYVDGDAVYVSISAANTSTITPGVFVSQAIFDNLGKIAAWTEWHKITPNALGTAESTGRTGLISVDAVTGHFAVVDGTNATTVHMTQWQNTSVNAVDGSANPKGLITNLNAPANLGTVCTAVCDLNSTTTAWGNVTPARMALFGGTSGKVCFAMTGSAWVANSAALITTNTALEVIFDTSNATTSLDYTSSNTLLLTTLPTGAGTVRALSHSGWYPVASNLTPGFFFAGAETGAGEGSLYVYAAPSLGAGYNQRNIKNFGVAPFGANSWQVLNGCDGIPVKIEAQGGAVYILTRKVDDSGNSTDRIFRLTKKANAADLNTNFIVTATAGAVNGAVSLENVKQIYDFVVSQTGTGTEQLTMLTNDGLYTTTSSAGCDAPGYNNAPASAMLNCGWIKVTTPATAENFMLKFFPQSHTRAPQTFIAAQWQASQTNENVYDQVALAQYGRASNSYKPLGQDVLTNFNAAALANGAYSVPTGFVQLPVITNLYSDGARRFMTSVSRSTSNHAMKMMSIPYRVDANKWNQASPYTVQDAALSSLGAVYWIRPIAGTMMIGCSNGGVVAQQ